MAKATKKDNTKWFTDARFGMFIHWGLYSMPARHEWIRNFERISNEDYQKYFDNFNPDLFNPKEWAKAAKDAGMKYFVITTKHHEGFCLWDSKHTDYKATKTPIKKDLLKEIIDAFRAEGIRVGLYYSLLDWHHPDFTIDAHHPLRDREDAIEMNKKRDMKKYAKYMRDQVTELLTNYGTIDIIWFDFSYSNLEYKGMKGKGKDDWESEKLFKLVKKLAPNIIINNRLDLPYTDNDIKTPEQFQPENPILKGDGEIALWEGCQTLSGSWGYHRDENTWKSKEQCIKMLINHVSRGGNLLMNVGPCSRGYLDYRALERLNDYAEWMKYNSRSIYECTVAPKEFEEKNGTRYTYNPKTNRLYIHIYDWPFERLNIKGLAGKIKYAQFLHDGSELKYADDQKKLWNGDTLPEDYATIFLPVLKPNITIPTIEIFLK